MRKRVLIGSVLGVVIIIALIMSGKSSVKAMDVYREPYVNDNDQYEVTCAGELKWVADQVNTNNYNQKDVILMNDINLSESDWKPIGISAMNDFDKTFDGNNKKITGLNLEYRMEDMQGYEAVGLFGYSSGEIKNLHVSGTIKTDMNVGGICGINKGNIINCTADINIITSGKGAGICYDNDGQLINVGNEGYIVGIEVAGICHDNFTGVIQNAYNIGDIESEADIGVAAGIVSSSVGKTSSVYNIGTISAYFSGNELELGSSGIENGYADISEEELLSGELAYKLNNDSSECSVAWRQVIGKDDYPTFYGKIVYKGYEQCSNIIYTNENVSNKPVHEYKSEYSADGYNHFHECINCDEHADVEPHVYEPGAKYENETHHTRLCKVCGYNIKIPHVWENPTVIESEEEDKADVTEYSCRDCDCKKTVEILVDEELPSGTLKMETTFFSGLFGGNKKTIIVDAFDAKSGVREIEYTLQEIMPTNFDILEWIIYKKGFKVNLKKYPYVYVKIVDNCGNYIVIDKDSQVVHTGAYDEPKTYEGNSYIKQ